MECSDTLTIYLKFCLNSCSSDLGLLQSIDGRGRTNRHHHLQCSWQATTYYHVSSAIGSLPERITVSNGVLKINNISRKDGGIYICKAENILGTAVTTAQLMVFSRLRFKVRPPAKLTALIGSPLRLPCVAESSLKPTITWVKDGNRSLPVDASILQNNTLVISSVTKSHEGSYTCKATNALSSIQATVQVKVAQ